MNHHIYVYQVAILVMICAISLSLHLIRLFKTKFNKATGFIVFLSTHIIVIHLILAGSEEIRKQDGDTIGLFLTDVMFYNYIFNPISLSIIALVGLFALFIMIIANLKSKNKQPKSKLTP